MIRILALYNRIYVNYSSIYHTIEIIKFLSKKLHTYKVVYLAVMTPPFVDHLMHNTCYTTVYMLLMQHRENEHAEISIIFMFVQFYETFYVTLKRKYLSRTNSNRI